MALDNRDLNTAIILCGGQSARPGFDKQRLKIQGLPIVIYIAKQLAQLFDEIIIVTNHLEWYDGYGYCVCSDIYRECGPLAGIHAGLKRSASEYAYVVPCDAPNVSLEFISWMKTRLITLPIKKEVLVVRRESGRIEPLNGFYSTNMAETIELCLSREIKTIHAVYQYVSVEMVDEKLVKKFIEKDNIFLNLNTKKEIRTYYRSLGLGVTHSIG